MDKKQREERIVEEKQKEKQAEDRRTKGKKGKSDGEKRNGQKETKTNVIKPSSVRQRILQCLDPIPVEHKGSKLVQPWA